MPQKTWSAERGRRDAHITERARHGKPVQASPSSVNDLSSGRALLQLRSEAQQRGLKGRSPMPKAQLEPALTP